MTDPFAYVPFAIAARGGTIDGIPVAQSVMAGLALLRRSAPLVRVLERTHSALLLPPSAAFLTALAASDGRCAVILDPGATPPALARQVDHALVGAVFTVRSLATRLPPGTPHVLLDDAPARATVVIGGRALDVTLTGHDTLRLDGDPESAGCDEPCIEIPAWGAPLGAPRDLHTHRALLTVARAAVRTLALTAADRMLALAPFSEPSALTLAGLAPLLAGAGVLTLGGPGPSPPAEAFDPGEAISALESRGVTTVAMTPDQVAALLHALTRRGAPLASATLRLAISVGAALPPAWPAQWLAATGTELRQG